ncbi:MAG: hypothetical protein JJT94_07635 [Bernardetiaceae bacterium]|nr:hypothetical protein [Bernardetiaceae bacterium]
MKIKGKVVYQDLGTGFYGIIGDDGKEWRPINMPAALEKDGLQVEVTAEKADGGMSIFMWGETIKISDYKKS